MTLVRLASGLLVSAIGMTLLPFGANAAPTDTEFFWCRCVADAPEMDEVVADCDALVGGDVVSVRIRAPRTGETYPQTIWMVGEPPGCDQYIDGKASCTSPLTYATVPTEPLACIGEVIPLD